MKTLEIYLLESIRHLSKGKTGIIVFDIDDTLIHADSSLIKVYKHINGDINNTVELSSDEFAKDPDAEKHYDWFDFSEFQNPIKVMNSIINGTPIIKNLRILDAYVNAGYEFCFLTARGCEDAIKYALNKILQIRDTDGILKDIGVAYNKTMSAAINTANKHYEGNTIPEKKANVLKSLCSKFDNVVFVDDDKRNVVYARKLQIPNLKVIEAWKK